MALADGGTETLAAKNVVIATGSEVTPLPGLDIDEVRIVSSTGALKLPSVPKRMAVIGGGVIGLEMGSVWARLGSEVTVVEFGPNIVPFMDGEVRKAFQRSLTKQGFKFKLGTKVVSAAPDGSAGPVALTLENVKTGAQDTLEADVVLVAAGRRPFTQGLNLEAAGIVTDERGRIKTDGHFRTTAPGGSVYAIGDVIEGPMLAHKARENRGRGELEGDAVLARAGGRGWWARWGRPAAPCLPAPIPGRPTPTHAGRGGWHRVRGEPGRPGGPRELRYRAVHHLHPPRICSGRHHGGGGQGKRDGVQGQREGGVGSEWDEGVGWSGDGEGGGGRAVGCECGGRCVRRRTAAPCPAPPPPQPHAPHPHVPTPPTSTPPPLTHAAPPQTGKFAFMANSRARTVDDSEGMVKFVADAETDKILGAHVMGPNAGELIAECVLAMEYGASTEDIARTCHGHPTLSEAVKEAALATYDKAIHS